MPDSLPCTFNRKTNFYHEYYEFANVTNDLILKIDNIRVIRPFVPKVRDQKYPVKNLIIVFVSMSNAAMQFRAATKSRPPVETKTIVPLVPLIHRSLRQ